MRPLIVVAFVLVLTVPTIAAAWNPLAFTIDVPFAQGGDQYRYSQLTRVRSEGTWGGTQLAFDGETEILLDVLGASSARDSFGVERPSLAYSLQQAARGQVEVRETCHMLEAGNAALRREYDVAPPSTAWSGGNGDVHVADDQIYGNRFEKDWTPVVSFLGVPCSGAGFHIGERLQEGQSLAFGFPLFAPGAPDGWAAPKSLPAEVTKFHGRDALRFTWDVADVFFWYESVSGEYSVTVADGLAMPALVTFNFRAVHNGNTRSIRAETELVGISAGFGPDVRPFGGARLPAQSPVADFVPYAPRALDDAPFAFPYSFNEAMSALLADAQSGLADFLDAHPRAVLTAALYERQMKATPGETVAHDAMDTDGGWLFHFADRSNAISVTSVRTTGATTPLGTIPAPTKLITNTRGDGASVARAPERLPADLASMPHLAALAAAEGINIESVQSLEYFLYDNGQGAPLAVLFVAEVPYMFGVGGAGDNEGLFATLLPNDGRMVSVTTSRRATATTGIVGRAVTLDDTDGRGGALSALAGPAAGAGLAAGAATAVALLFVFVKFLLLPLFTRLRRDALLDNPIRARMVELVRTDPGIHLAELVADAGVGYGGTRHHLDHLVKARILTELELDGRKRYFVTGDVPPAMAREAALLRTENARRIYELLRTEPTLTLRQASARLGMSAPAIHRTKKKLETAGLLPAAPDAEASVIKV